MNLFSLLILLVILVVTQAKHKPKEKKHESALVLTESGELCHFPFIYGRMVYRSCIRRGKHGPKPWCSLTRNYDLDQRWSYCIEKHKVTDHCEDDDPCEPRGVCESKLKGYHCVCKEPYTGRHCLIDKCFDKTLQQYFEPKEKWLRYTPPILEECTCGQKGSVCKPTKGKACAINPCLNGGHCIQDKRTTVCGCVQGHIGPHCEIRPSEICYSGNGTSYRGTASVTVTGLSCLPWDSDIIHHEVSHYSGFKAKDYGIGPHPYCRNPDGDTQPWCFILIEERLSWEHCLIPKCNVITASTLQPQTSKPETPSLGPTSSTSRYDPPPNTTAKMDRSRGMPTSCEKKFQKTPSITPRIVGGLVALPASHPYVAALYISSHFCGGSLISSCWILTAAHCLEQRPNVKEITVVLGQSLFNTTDTRTRTFQVERYILHEKYDENTFQHDIALVRLKSTTDACAEFTQFVQPICLPQNVADRVKQCTVVGWGHQYHGADEYALFLQEARIPIIPNTQCQSPDVHGNKMLSGMMCAGVMAGGVDACQGDSGGPLVCEVDGKIELHGIVSWGSGCGEENKPGVYTDVSSYIDWILKNLN
ncbi:coagulation factor XII [Spea bombifrons]|uniref:coagulation factor XII n=1 Tax=Spea bombifrons TaxID=233779 RepID=UPI0023490872|nr:coagulation factor XII [Spea bombifrons]